VGVKLMRYVLEGIRVLDLSQMWACPGAAAYLADFGADVIKVEPLWGDDARRTFTQRPMPNGESRSYLVVNRSKRGLAIDITKPAGKEIINRLADQSDVLLHNFRPGVVERLGLDYETLAARNSGLVYAHLTAYGERGPYAHRPGYDLLFQALAGLMGRRSLPDGTPLGPGAWISDMSAPLSVAYGVVLALLAKERTGRGQRVDTSLLQMAIAMQAVDVVQIEDEPPASQDGSSPMDQAMFGSYRCADGKWIVIVVIADKHWRSLCQCLGLEHLADAPAFSTTVKRLENSDDLYQLLTGVFRTQPRDYWVERFAEFDIPGAPILIPEEVFDTPQIVENRMLVTMNQPGVGKVKFMNVPVRLSETPGEIRFPAPLTLGQHTEEILRELGYGPAAIQRLRKQEVIR